MERVRDMTEGKPASLIVSFALPLMLGSIFQHLYTLVDTAIVGRYVGVKALASVGAADWPSWLILGIVIGFAQGMCILIAQRFGANDYDGMRRSVTHSYILGLILAVFFTLIAHLTLRPMLVLLKTPEETIGGTITYMRFIYSGMVVVTAYNLFSSVLRALGDSKSPLIAMILASVCNIALDLLFVRVFNWGIPGAAIATMISQILSAVYCFVVVRRIEILKLQKDDWRIDKGLMKELTKLGAPLGLQNGIIGVGGLAVQYAVNSFGFVFLAGFTASNKLYGLIEMAAVAYGFAVSTYAGQNLGARKIHRIRQGLRAAVLIGLATSLAITVSMIFAGKSIISIFLSGEPKVIEEAMRVAYNYLLFLCVPLFILYFLHIYRSALQGMGDTFRPMISGFVELIMRVGVALILPRLIGENGVFLCEGAAWVGAIAILIPSYYIRIRKEGKAQLITK